jgi:hypothetical protein
MSVSLVAAAMVTIAAAVMVRRFYPDRIVMQYHETHGDGDAAGAPAASSDVPAGTGTNGHNRNGAAGGPRSLEEVGR